MSTSKDEMFGRALGCLNSAFKTDPCAIHSLIANRVPANIALMQHPHIIVDTLPSGEKNENYVVGLLGVVNGMMTSMCLPLIAMQWQDNEDGSKKFIGFTKYAL